MFTASEMDVDSIAFHEYEGRTACLLYFNEYNSRKQLYENGTKKFTANGKHY